MILNIVIIQYLPNIGKYMHILSKSRQMTRIFSWPFSFFIGSRWQSMIAENEKYWQDELSTLGIECKRKMNLMTRRN
jgi:hypothetical protein